MLSSKHESILIVLKNLLGRTKVARACFDNVGVLLYIRKMILDIFFAHNKTKSFDIFTIFGSKIIMPVKMIITSPKHKILLVCNSGFDHFRYHFTTNINYNQPFFIKKRQVAGRISPCTHTIGRGVCDSRFFNARSGASFKL